MIIGQIPQPPLSLQAEYHLRPRLSKFHGAEQIVFNDKFACHWSKVYLGCMIETICFSIQICLIKLVEIVWKFFNILSKVGFWGTKNEGYDQPIKHKWSSMMGNLNISPSWTVQPFSLCQSQPPADAEDQLRLLQASLLDSAGRDIDKINSLTSGHPFPSTFVEQLSVSLRYASSSGSSKCQRVARTNPV